MFCSPFLYSFKHFSDLLFFATLWFSIKVIQKKYFPRHDTLKNIKTESYITCVCNWKIWFLLDHKWKYFISHHIFVPTFFWAYSTRDSPKCLQIRENYKSQVLWRPLLPANHSPPLCVSFRRKSPSCLGSSPTTWRATEVSVPHLDSLTPSRPPHLEQPSPETCQREVRPPAAGTSRPCAGSPCTTQPTCPRNTPRLPGGLCSAPRQEVTTHPRKGLETNHTIQRQNGWN